MCKDKLPVFEIERFAIHDGPGIRTVVFLQGCPLRCSWCANPESQEGRKHLLQFSKKCTGCGRCVQQCPAGAITIQDGKCNIDRQRCLTCGKCASTCFNDALRISGQDMDVFEIKKTILKDSIYYETSGGGVTFSGGEALLHAERLVPLWKELKQEKISIAVETCGHVPVENVQMAADFVDLFLFDLKTMDEDKFQKYAGGCLEIVLSAFRMLCKKMADRVIVRIPVIPRFNDTKESLVSIMEFAAGNGVSRVDMLPYHTLGIAKYEQLGRQYPYPVKQGLDPESLAEYVEIGKQLGLTVTVG